MQTSSSRLRVAVGLFLAACLNPGCSDGNAVLGSERARDGTRAPSEQPPLRVAGRSLVPRVGDLSELLDHRQVRVLVPYAPPYFFFDGAGPRGITQEVFREYGSFVEEQAGLRAGDLTVVYIPCELDAMLPWLNAGYGDVAAALTVTPERAAQAAFAAPLLTEVEEILVTGPASPELGSLTELSAREVWVTAGSSYVEHLRELSAELVAQGLAPVEVRVAPPTLSTEDLLEMVHAGIIEAIVCDDYRAELWAGVLDGLVLHQDLAVHTAGELAWSVRHGNDDLLASLNAFSAQARKGTLLGNILVKRYFDSTRWIEDPTDPDSVEDLERYAKWMQELGAEYDFDWLRIAAQCFQESGLDPQAESSAGALGLMQLLPSTGRDMGCDDLLDPEQNLRAGVRYLDWLRTNFFAEPELDEVERMDFILAAYNAGPGNVRKWRKLAPERGLDPNRWRENVERLAREHVGVQPIHYVDNIEKYYVAYSLALDLTEARKRVRGE